VCGLAATAAVDQRDDGPGLGGVALLGEVEIHFLIIVLPIRAGTVANDLNSVSIAGCGKTACWVAWMRFPERRSGENRRFSCREKVAEDFFHGQLVRLLQFFGG